jgi:deazaflavin-dependent oxidoreductase (nitroreductase family)
LGYFESEGDYVIIASNAGFDSHPGWFLNLKSNPRTHIEIGGRRIEVIADITDTEKRDQLWARLIELSPGYANYSKRTGREIPVVKLHPVNG